MRSKLLRATVVLVLAAGLTVGTASAAGTGWTIEPLSSATGLQVEVGAGAGASVVVWLEGGLLYAAVHTAGGWTAPAAISTVGENAEQPVAAVSTGGVPVVAWAQYDAGFANPTVRTSSFDGTTWAPPRVLDSASTVAGTTSLVADPDGSLVLAWVKGDGGPVTGWTATIAADGSLLTGPTSLGNPSVGVQLAVIGNGDVAALWVDDASGDTIVTERRGGTWGAPAVLVPTAAGAAAVLAGGGGRFVVAYTDGSVVHTVVDDGSGWGAPVTATPAGAFGHQLVVDGHGVATLVWQSSDAGGDRIGTATSHDGTTWVEGAPVATGLTGISRFDLAITPSGSAIVVWLLSSGEWWSASRYEGAWSAPEQVDAADNCNSGPVVDVDALGNATAGWLEDGTRAALGATAQIPVPTTVTSTTVPVTDPAAVGAEVAPAFTC